MGRKAKPLLFVWGKTPLNNDKVLGGFRKDGGKKPKKDHWGVSGAKGELRKRRRKETLKRVSGEDGKKDDVFDLFPAKKMRRGPIWYLAGKEKGRNQSPL